MNKCATDRIILKPYFVCLNQLVGDSPLDPFYSHVVLFGIDTRCCVEDNGRRKTTSMIESPG